MKTILLSIAVVLLLTWAGVSPGQKEFRDIDAFEKYVTSEESHLIQSITKNGVKVTVRYIPTDAMLIRNYRELEELKKKLDADALMSAGQKEISLRNARAELSGARETYDKSIYFSMTIGYEDGKRDIEYERMREGYGRYTDWVNKLLFRMNEYVFLHTPINEDVPLGLCNMDRSFGITRDKSFLLAFTRTFNAQDLFDQKHRDCDVRLEEFGLGLGQLHFRFPIPASYTTQLCELLQLTSH